MKKIILVVFILLLTASMIPVTFAEEGSGTQFESVLLKKGSITVQETIDVTEDNFTDYSAYIAGVESVRFQATIGTDVATNQKVYAMIMKTRGQGKDFAAILDLDEVDDAITTLKYIKDHAPEMENYTEIRYKTSGGFTVVGYHTVKGSCGAYIIFESQLRKYYDLKQIDTLIDAMQSVKDVLNSKMKEAGK